MFSLALHFAGVWTLPLLDRDEPRFAEASREMLARKDWVVPYFNNHYRFDKPPLIYWMEVGSFTAFGQPDWAVRIPSILASAFTSLILFCWGRRAAGERAGFWAALIFATSLQVLIHSKLCVADPLLICFVTLGMWAGWELVTKANLLWSAVFVIALGFGFLAKGPIAWLPIGMVAAMRWRRLKDSLSWWRIIILWAASVALVGLWGLPALMATHGEFFRQGLGHHVIARGLTSFEEHGGGGWIGYVALLPYYFVTIFFSFFPWSICLPWLARRLRTDWDELTIYLFSGIAAIVLLFTFYSTRLPHYILPAFPALSLLLAREWVRAGRKTAFLRGGVIGMAVLDVVIALAVFPVLKDVIPAPQLARLSEPWLKPEMEFAATVLFDEPSLVWYFRGKVNGYFSSIPPEGVAGFMAKPGPRFCIVPAELAVPALSSDCRMGEEFSGFNVVNGQRVRLRIIIKTN